MPSLDTLIARLGLPFNDRRLLESALTHRSLRHERPERAIGLLDEERLEFLGDSILNYLVADLVYARFPEYTEGQLTRLRAALVKTSTLATLARALDLGAYLRLAKGEASSGARTRDSLLADTFEALVAAIYLDQGLEAARAFVLRMLVPELARVEAEGLPQDYKSRLQEFVQAARNVTPRYVVLAVEGRDPHREYTIEVRIGDEPAGLGRGRSKQVAAQAAARAALERLEDQLGAQSSQC